MIDTQLCPTLQPHGPRSPPGFSVHGILQARRLEWVAISFSKVINECLFIKWMIATIVLSGSHMCVTKFPLTGNKFPNDWILWVTFTLLMQIRHSLTFSQAQITICIESDRLKKYNPKGKLSTYHFCHVTKTFKMSLWRKHKLQVTFISKSHLENQHLT